MLEKIRCTMDNQALGIIRIFIGFLILMTGVMKFLFPMLRNAWSGQLIGANIPFYTFNFWVVPIVEIVVGSLLALGLFARVGSLVVMGIMTVATYVHLTVNDPTLFPLQPKEPIIPLIVFVLSGYVLWRGGGAWSLDLKSSNPH